METNHFLYVFIVISTVTVSSHAAQSKVLKYFSVNETVEKLAETQWTGEDKNPEVQTQYKPVVTSPKEADYKLSYANYDITWKNFKLEHKRTYASTSEEERRFAIFMDNVKTIEKHNWQFHLGHFTYWMDINQFSDWTPEEFQAMLLPPGVNSTSMWAGLPRLVYKADSNASVPDSIDWRSKGYVTPVINQGNCGACYAISTTGSIEGQWYKKTQKLIPLSVQQIVDCSHINRGCIGGYFEASIGYVIVHGGLESESDYPYKAKKGTCKFQASRAVVKVKDYHRVEKTEKDLQIAVGTEGPVEVGYIPISESLRFYKGGIFVDRTCSKGRILGYHFMLAVGYGRVGDSDYWIVKNSWGTDWGDEGYIYMARNLDNMCDIASDAHVPEV